jgi:1,4-dihydroxy-2-naphthoate octaprenyltransferase
MEYNPIYIETDFTFLLIYFVQHYKFSLHAKGQNGCISEYLAVKISIPQILLTEGILQLSNLRQY